MPVEVRMAYWPRLYRLQAFYPLHSPFQALYISMNFPFTCLDGLPNACVVQTYQVHDILEIAQVHWAGLSASYDCISNPNWIVWNLLHLLSFLVTFVDWLTKLWLILHNSFKNQRKLLSKDILSKYFIQRWQNLVAFKNQGLKSSLPIYFITMNVTIQVPRHHSRAKNKGNVCLNRAQEILIHLEINCIRHLWPNHVKYFVLFSSCWLVQTQLPSLRS